MSDHTTNKPCPFCGSFDSSTINWWGEDEDEIIKAIECSRCKAAAPREWWNRRATLYIPDLVQSPDADLQ